MMELKDVHDVSKTNASGDGKSTNLVVSTTVLEPRLKRVLDILKSKHPNKMPGADDKHFVVSDIFLMSVKNMSTTESTVAVEYDVQYWWMDEAFVGKDDAWLAENWNKIWNPNFEYTPFESNETVIAESADSYVFQFEPHHGIVSMLLRFKGVIQLSLDVHKFPYDAQKVRMKVSSYTRSMSGCEFVPLCTKDENSDNLILMTKNVGLPEWDVLAPVEIFHAVDHCYDGRDYSQIQLVLYVRRRPQFYLSKVISLIIIIGSMSIGAMILSPDSLNDRFQVTLTLLLTQIAFNFVINEALPKVSYVTSLDKYFLCNYLLLVMEYAEHIVSYLVHSHYSEDVAVYLDYAMIAFAALWLSIITGAFFHACYSGPPAYVLPADMLTTPPDSPTGNKQFEGKDGKK